MLCLTLMTFSDMRKRNTLFLGSLNLEIKKSALNTEPKYSSLEADRQVTIFKTSTDKD